MKRALLLILLCSPTAWAQTPPITAGPFQGNLDSLKQYDCPDWFRDAKFGIWAHWGPQAVPMMGDWYAKHMYVPGHPQYEYHLATYGHPSEHGYKDIIALWKAEKWDPDRLMSLYKKAGAKYFVSMGSHHDNFYLWNSKLHEWNAVKMGPHRDVVGDWQKAARKYGLRFGVSEHLGASSRLAPTVPHYTPTSNSWPRLPARNWSGNRCAPAAGPISVFWNWARSSLRSPAYRS